MDRLAVEILPREVLAELRAEERKLFYGSLESYGEHFRRRFAESGMGLSGLEITLSVNPETTPVSLEHSFSRPLSNYERALLCSHDDEDALELAFGKTALFAEKLVEAGMPVANVTMRFPIHYLIQADRRIQHLFWHPENDTLSTALNPTELNIRTLVSSLPAYLRRD